MPICPFQRATVSDLEGVRRPTRRPLGIAHDDRDAGVGCQPSRQCVGPAVWQQVNDAPAFEVAQDRSVPVAPAPGPIIHPQNRHWSDRHVDADAHPMSQRRPADWHADGPGMTGAGIAAECQTNGLVHGPQPVGLACPRAGNAGQEFGKGATRTLWHWSSGSAGRGSAARWGVRSTPHHRDYASRRRERGMRVCRSRCRIPRKELAVHAR